MDYDWRPDMEVNPPYRTPNTVKRSHIGLRVIYSRFSTLEVSSVYHAQDIERILI